jgi:hypothetical protein
MGQRETRTYCIMNCSSSKGILQERFEVILFK